MRFFSRVFLPLLLLGYIGTETYLKLQHSSLCGEVGCKLAAELLNFDAMYLNYFGLAGLFVLIILGALSLKSTLYESLFFVGLYGAIAFEATIISYQFVVNPEPCIFCLGIFSSLLLIALFSQLKHFAITLATVLAIFVGMNTLAVTKNKSFIVSNGNYLIQSETCSHCKKVKAYFAEYKIDYTSISVKEASARSFLKFAGITSIPVLLTKDTKGISMLVGDHKIIKHYKAQNAVTTAPLDVITATMPSTQSSAIEALPRNLFNAVSEPGCAITIVETPDCDKNSIKN